ncbi:MAG: DoxX family protein [Bacteroidota bacterium]
MDFKKKYNGLIDKLKNLKSFPLLAIRLVLAIGFFGPAKMKIGNIDNIAQWFESMGYPLPTLNAYLAAGTESLGVILLFLGLGTRLISIPLMIVMLVAIFTVHLANGFAAGSNGFEIPLYYFIMLFTLLVFGGGKFSIDHLIKNK